jgi:hypothetical protein
MLAAMPVTYVIDTDKRLIHTICSGVVTVAEVVGHFRTLRDDPVCTGYLDVLLDVRDATSAPETSELRVVTEEVAAVRKKVEFGMLAIIASGDVIFGMMRMFAVFAESFFRAIQVFREIGEAEAWIRANKQSSRGNENAKTN